MWLKCVLLQIFCRVAELRPARSSCAMFSSPAILWGWEHRRSKTKKDFHSAGTFLWFLIITIKLWTKHKWYSCHFNLLLSSCHRLSHCLLVNFFSSVIPAAWTTSAAMSFHTCPLNIPSPRPKTTTESSRISLAAALKIDPGGLSLRAYSWINFLFNPGLKQVLILG